MRPSLLVVCCRCSRAAVFLGGLLLVVWVWVCRWWPALIGHDWWSLGAVWIVLLCVGIGVVMVSKWCYYRRLPVGGVWCLLVLAGVVMGCVVCWLCVVVCIGYECGSVLLLLVCSVLLVVVCRWWWFLAVGG